MTALTRWIRRAWARWRYRDFERDLQEELSIHESMVQADFERRGLSPDDAHRHARRVLGNSTLARESARAVWMPMLIDRSREDIRYAMRSLAHHPGHTLTSFMTLALAIGLNASLFNFFDAVFLRPWPVPDPSRVFIASLVAPRGASRIPSAEMSYDEFLSLQEHATTADLVAWGDARLGVRIAASDEPETVHGLVVSRNFFTVVGARLARGLGFRTGETEADAPTVIVSDSLWRGRLGADPNVIGRTVFLEDIATTIVGVVSPRFGGIPPERIDFYVPFPASRALSPTWRAWVGDVGTDSSPYTVSVGGRLRLGSTRGLAALELSAMHRQFPGTRFSRGRDIGLGGTTTGEQTGVVSSGIPVVFVLLFGACVLVLVLACANVGNLQLARSLGRLREITTRLALGASRRRVVRQLVTESVVLTLLAGLGAMGVAWALPPVVLSLYPATSLTYTPDAAVLAYSALACVATTLACGLVPALRVTQRSSLATMFLNDRGAGASSGRTRGLLLGVQVAISTVLLVSAMLLTRGILKLTSEDPGFAVTDVAVGTLTASKHALDGTRASLFASTLSTAADKAGFTHVALTGLPPLSGVSASSRLRLSDQPANTWLRVSVQSVSSNFFDVLEIPVTAGRTLSDDPGRAEVVINQTLARQLQSQGVRIGSQFTLDGSTSTVVGIVRDAHLKQLQGVMPTVFRSLSTSDVPYVLVRDSRPDAPVRLQSVVRAVDDHVVIRTAPLRSLVLASAQDSIIGASVASGIGLLALALATVGVFAMFGYLVESQRREIGIRLALGARGSQVVRFVLASSSRALLTGLGAGLILAVAAGFVLRGYLFGLSPLDLTSYLGVGAILAVAATVATYAPARRAITVDPVATLRCE